MNTRLMLILYFFVMNLLGLSAMVIDKIRAMERRFRIPESVLFILAILGGSAGCIAGMIIFRHKKRKPQFRYGLPLILILQISAWLALHIAQRMARASYSNFQDRFPVKAHYLHSSDGELYESIQDH